MSYYEPRVPKVEAYHLRHVDDWPHIVQAVRPYGFEVTFTGKDGNPADYRREEPHAVALTLHTFKGGIQVEVNQTVYREGGEWRVQETRDFNEKWQPAKLEPGFSR